jgi:hypothetical protein
MVVSRDAFPLIGGLLAENPAREKRAKSIRIGETKERMFYLSDGGFLDLGLFLFVILKGCLDSFLN